eukprot:scaffold22132_cov69-Phaeocystis_antarctica.AAC.3
MRCCQAWPRGGQPRHGRRLKDSVIARRSDKTSLYAASRGAMITGVCACGAVWGGGVGPARALIWWTGVGR